MKNVRLAACFLKCFAAVFALTLTYAVAAAEGGAKTSNIASRLDIIGARVHGQPPVALEDLSALEPVCELVMRHLKRGDDNPSIGLWYEQLKDSPLLDLRQYNIAKGALSFHHYCWAEIVRNRSYREKDAKLRFELAGYVISSHKWMIDNPQYLPNQWPYLHQLYVKMGTGYLLQHNNAQATSAFLTALRLNPRYLTTYNQLSDTLVKAGDKKSALAHVSEGLRYFPNAKSLKRRYDELGGKPPYPEPYPSEAPSEQTAEPATDLKQEQPAVQVSGASESPGEPEDGKVVDTSSKTAAEQAEPASKDNPYCRFCAE